MATKTALLIVDMQNDFTKPGARAYYPTTEKLMETFEQKINVLRNKGVQIVIIYSLVPDDHKPDPELTRITKTTRTLVEGTYGAEIDERISYDPTRDWKMRKYASEKDEIQEKFRKVHKLKSNERKGEIQTRKRRP